MESKQHEKNRSHLEKGSLRHTSLISGAAPAFRAIAQEYLRAWGLCCILTDTEGNLIDSGPEDIACRLSQDCGEFRSQAIYEALRWGEPAMQLCPGGYVVWAVPVMHNSDVIGGIVVEKVTVGDDDSGETMSPNRTRLAATALMDLAIQANLTNSSFLQSRKEATMRESERAEAIHELKDVRYESIREIYLKEEPSLISAIKRGDRPAAREILNRVLVGIYFWGRERPNLLKSFILELVVTMTRSAVEAGGDPSELLGANYSSISELATIDSEEDLCAWLVSTLERIMDAIKSNRDYPNSVLLNAALKYMRTHLHEAISRDDVADVACLSPSHFSRVVKSTFGYSFTDLLSRMRVEKACELLTYTSKSLMEVTVDCGFSDQSYFTKVFQRYTGQTPGEYKRAHRGSPQA